MFFQTPLVADEPVLKPIFTGPIGKASVKVKVSTIRVCSAPPPLDGILLNFKPLHRAEFAAYGVIIF